MNESGRLWIDESGRLPTSVFSETSQETTDHFDTFVCFSCRMIHCVIFKFDQISSPSSIT